MKTAAVSRCRRTASTSLRLFFYGSLRARALPGPTLWLMRTLRLIWSSVQTTETFLLLALRLLSFLLICVFKEQHFQFPSNFFPFEFTTWLANTKVYLMASLGFCQASLLLNVIVSIFEKDLFLSFCIERQIDRQTAGAYGIQRRVSDSWHGCAGTWTCVYKNCALSAAEPGVSVLPSFLFKGICITLSIDLNTLTPFRPVKWLKISRVAGEEIGSLRREGKL